MLRQRSALVFSPRWPPSAARFDLFGIVASRSVIQIVRRDIFWRRGTRASKLASERERYVNARTGLERKDIGTLFSLEKVKIFDQSRFSFIFSARITSAEICFPRNDLIHDICSAEISDARASRMKTDRRGALYCQAICLRLQMRSQYHPILDDFLFFFFSRQFAQLFAIRKEWNNFFHSANIPREFVMWRMPNIFD